MKALNLETKNICVWVKPKGCMGSLYCSWHEFVFVFKNGAGQYVNNVEPGKHGRNRTNVWECAGINSFGKTRDAALDAHPTVKPISLVGYALKDCSKRKGIVLDPYGLLETISSYVRSSDAKSNQSERSITLSIKASLQRCGIEKRLVIGGPQHQGNYQQDKALLLLLSRAHQYNDMLLTSNDGCISKLADEIGVTSSYFSRIARLGFWASNIVSAIMNGKQPTTLTARKLAHDTNLAINWTDQREQLGTGNSKELLTTSQVL